MSEVFCLFCKKYQPCFMCDFSRNIKWDVPAQPLNEYRPDGNNHRRVAGFAKCMLENSLRHSSRAMLQCVPFQLFSFNGTNKCWDFVAFCIEQVCGSYNVEYIKSIDGNDRQINTWRDLMAVQAGSILKIYNACEDHVAHAAVAIGGGVFAGANPYGYISADRDFTAVGAGGVWTYNNAKRFLYANSSY